MTSFCYLKYLKANIYFFSYRFALFIAKFFIKIKKAKLVAMKTVKQKQD